MIALLPREAWRRNQLVVCVAVFMVFMGFAFVLPFLPLYVRQLGVSSDESVERISHNRGTVWHASISACEARSSPFEASRLIAVTQPASSSPSLPSST